MNGNIKFFNAAKGFGFITGEDDKDYFVHITNVPAGLEMTDDLEVNFETEEGERGPKAVKITVDE